MKFLVLRKIHDCYYLVGNKPFENEQQAEKMLDLQKDCNPTENFCTVAVLDEENLEVVKK